MDRMARRRRRRRLRGLREVDVRRRRRICVLGVTRGVMRRTRGVVLRHTFTFLTRETLFLCLGRCQILGMGRGRRGIGGGYGMIG